MATTATVNVQVNTQQAIDELDKAKDNVVKLRKALNDAISQGKSPLSIQQLSRALRTAQADVKKMQSELVNVDQQMRRLSTSNIDELEGVIKTINRRLRDGSVQQGSQEWQKLCGQLGQAKRRLDEVNRSITSQITNIDNGIGKLDKLNLKQLESLVGSITNKLFDGSIQRGSKQWDPMVEKLRLARKELDKVKQQLSGGAVDIKGGMAHLDTLNLKELDDLVGAINAKFKDGSVQRGSLQWKQLAEQLRQAEAELKAARDGIKNGVVNINQAMGQLQTLNVSQLDGLIKAINKKLNDGSVQRGSKQWDTLSEQLRRAKTELAGVKEQLEHAVVDISAQMGKLKTLGFADMEQLVGAINRKLRDGSVQRGSEEWKKLAEQLRQARRELSEVNSELTNGDSWMGRYAEHLNKFQYVWVQVAGAITGTVMAYTEWEKYFKKKDTAKANVQALTGMSKADVQWLADQAELLSSTSIGGLRIADDAADILQNMRLVGAAKPELLKNKEALEKTTIEAARLATASMEDLDVCVDALTKSLNIYSQGADQAAKFTNVLAAGSRFGASAVGDTAKVVIRAGVAAAGAKIPIEQLVGCTEMLAEKGLMGEKAGTALKTFFLKLQTGARNCNPAVVGLDKALENLAKQHLTASDMLKMFEQRAFNAAKILIDNRDKMKYYTEAVTGTSVAYEQACINSDSFETRLAQLKNSLNVVKEQLAVELKPVIGQVLIMMRTWITYLLPLIKWIKQHSTAIKLLVGAVAVYLGKLLVLKALHSSVVVGVVSFCSSLFKLKTYIGLATVVMGKWRGALMAVKSTLLACSVGFKGFVGHIKKATAAIKAFVLASNMRTAGIVGAVMAIGTAFVFLKDKIFGTVKESKDFVALMKQIEEMREGAAEQGREEARDKQRDIEILKNEKGVYTREERQKAEEELRSFFPELKLEWEGEKAVILNEVELMTKLAGNDRELEIRMLQGIVDSCDTILGTEASKVNAAEMERDKLWQDFAVGISKNTSVKSEVMSWWNEKVRAENAELKKSIAAQMQAKANETGTLLTDEMINSAYLTSGDRQQEFSDEAGRDNSASVYRAWFDYQAELHERNKKRLTPGVLNVNSAAVEFDGVNPFFSKWERRLLDEDLNVDDVRESSYERETGVHEQRNKAWMRLQELLSERKADKAFSKVKGDVPGKSHEERENEDKEIRRRYQTWINRITHQRSVGREGKGKYYDGVAFLKEHGRADKWLISSLRKVWAGCKDEMSDLTVEQDKLFRDLDDKWRELNEAKNNVGSIKFHQFDEQEAKSVEKKIALPSEDAPVEDGGFKVEHEFGESTDLDSWSAEENKDKLPLAFGHESLMELYRQLKLSETYSPEDFERLGGRATMEAIEPLIRKAKSVSSAKAKNRVVAKSVAESKGVSGAAGHGSSVEGSGLKGTGVYEQAVKERDEAKRKLDSALFVERDLKLREFNAWKNSADRDESVHYTMTEGQKDSYPWSDAVKQQKEVVRLAEREFNEKERAVNPYGGGTSTAAYDGLAHGGSGLHEVFSYLGLENLDSLQKTIEETAETTERWFVDRDENPTIENYYNYTTDKYGRVGEFDEDGYQTAGINYDFAGMEDPIGFIEHLLEFYKQLKEKAETNITEGKAVQLALDNGDFSSAVGTSGRYELFRADPNNSLYQGEEEVENLKFAWRTQAERSIEKSEARLPAIEEGINKCLEWLQRQGVSKNGAASSVSNGVEGGVDGGRKSKNVDSDKFVRVPKYAPRSEYEKASNVVVENIPQLNELIDVTKLRIQIALDERALVGKQKDSKEYVDLQSKITENKIALDELRASYKTPYNFGMSRVVENPAGLDYTQTSTDDKLNNLRRDILEYQHTRDLTLQNANTENLQKIATMNDEFIDMCVAYFKQINDKYEEQFGGVFAGMADKVKSVDLSKYVGKSTKSVKAEYNYVDELTRQLFDRIDDYYSGKRLSNEQKQEKQDKEAAIGNQSKVLKQRITALNFDDLLSENAKTMRQEHQYLDQLRQDDLLSEEVYLEKKKEMQWRHFNTVLERAKQIYESIDSVVQASQEYSAACIEEETARIEKSYEKRIQACGNSSRRAALLERQKEKDIAKIKNEHNRRAVAIQIAQAIAQTAFNAVEAYGSMAKIPVVGPVLAAIAMASAIAAGMLQVATIKKQAAAQAAGYQSGGFTPKGKPDEVQGAVHSGEFVANRYAVRNPELLPALQLIDAAQRNNTVGRLTAEDVTRSLRTRVSPDVVEAVSVGGERLQSVQSDNGAALVATSKALSRSGQVLDKLEQRLEEGITAVSVIDGDNGVHRQLRKYEKLVANGRR